MLLKNNYYYCLLGHVGSRTKGLIIGSFFSIIGFTVSGESALIMEQGDAADTENNIYPE